MLDNLRTVQHLLEQSSSLPDTIAIKAGSRAVTYAELEEEISVLASCLLTQAAEAKLIGISTTRSVEMIVGVLAILRAGKGYVPLDPAYPASRLARMVANAGLTTCLAPAAETDLFTSLGLQLLAADESGPVVPAPAETGPLAYVLYTSGSTGEPKGVAVGHAALTNLIRWQNKESAAGVGTRTLQFATLSFDVSIQEITTTLSTGGTLVLLDEAQRQDFSALLNLVVQEQVNRIFLPFVALQHLAELSVSRQQFPTSLTEIMTAGEQLKVTPQLVAFCTALPGCTLYNQYGPTETCVIATQLVLTGDPADWPRLPSIGRAVDNTALHLLTPDQQLAAPGEVGELCVSGVSLAEGYLNQPARTAERFIFWTPPTGPPLRLYRTGDLARWQPDGNLEFLGREDGQVKIRGHRVELGEVEALLATLPGVSQAAVTMWQENNGLKELVAYVIATDADFATPAALRRAAAQVLPDYMLPATFVLLPTFPKTSSGKLDRLALPAPTTQARAALGTPYQAPRTPTERHLAAAWAPLLRLDKVGATDNFFELGGTSLLAQQAVARLRAEAGYQLPVTKLYQYPTVAGAAAYLDQQAAAGPTLTTAGQALPSQPLTTDNDIAVIGMSGRFPGAATVEELWDVLREGRETIRFFTEEELDASVPAALRDDPRYVRARGIINHAEEFDAAFFKLNPRLAAAMDPQQRVFLELAWEVLEQTGHLPAHYAGRVGVFAGTGNNTYYPHNVQGNPAAVNQLGDFQVMTVNEKDYLALRVSYTLDLRGPSVSVHSACSTSLLAVAQAVQSLRAGQCEVALAGGASITTPIRSGYLSQEGAMLSPDGHCRPFDARAQGTIFSDGAGAVLLKPLAAARRDGDVVYGVIKGVGISNDGRDKGSFSAPSAAGQAAAIRAALADGGVAPATLSYVEAHGTATPLGDPIEVEGLRLAFGPDVAPGSCALGSIKSNLGHLVAAAGVAGLIKTLLALHHGQLPATLHYTEPNPHLDLANSPFVVNAAQRDWPVVAGTPRRAGISSFGVGGTNVHVVVEEAPTPPARPEAPALGRPVQLVTWAARSAVAAATYARRLDKWLTDNPAAALADVAFTLQTTRAPLAERRLVMAATLAELPTALAAAPAAHTLTQVPGAVVFLLPGQGAQYVNMGRELYDHELAYRAAVDECAELLIELLGLDVRQLLYPADGQATPALTARLQDTRYTQPALFVTEYALAQLWLNWGVRPTALAGHSLGEWVAGCLAGIFTLPDVLRLVAERARLVSELPAGQMLAVRASVEQITALLPPTLDLATVNGPKAVAVAGPAEDITAFAAALAAQDIPSRPLATSHAFHSRQMEPAVAALAQLLATVPLAAPRVPIVSNVTGTWLTDAQATDPAYWAGQLRQPVQFAAVLNTLLSEPNPLLLEVGPGTTLTALVRQQAAGRAHAALASLPTITKEKTDYQTILTTLGQLWLRGLEPDWQAFYAGQGRQKLHLPATAFDRVRCWLEPVAPAPVVATINSVPATPVIPSESSNIVSALPLSLPPTMKHTLLLPRIASVLADAADVDLTPAQADHTFLELGLDSLLLTQVALTLKKSFGVPVTFRQLNEGLTTPATLADYLAAHLPAEAAPLASAAALPYAPAAALPPAPAAIPTDPTLSLLAAQLQQLTQQMAQLQAAGTAAPVAAAHYAPAALPPPAAPELTAAEAVEHAKPFGATARIERQVATALTPAQQDFLNQLTRRYTQKTSASKAYTQQHRPHMADPRVVSGFTPLLKELTYPLVVDRSAGSRLWDLDGNEYVDALNGFGSSLFGHQPEFVKTALHAQIERGYEVGPQHALAGEVCQLLGELTGHERVALCNTGSEAVLGALRMARTVTGRSLVVAFTGSYHGINDEVIVRGTRQLKSRPAASGIMPESVQNMLILDYGTEESLRIIAERAHELAAVLVEPIQSRRPDFQPVEFLKEVRRVTAAAGTALIFDEIITGFRLHPGGAQGAFGIRADIATYGKVIGGGLPIGAIAGNRLFLDALDGGFWQYGDRSVPEVGVTYFAGTFVRHPLALASTLASLHHLRAQGAALPAALNAATAGLVAQLNAAARQRQMPLEVVYAGSLWKIKFTTDLPYSTLLFTLMREKGVHIWDNFPCFLTEAHSAADVQRIVAAFTSSLDELAAVGLVPATAPMPAALPTPAPAPIERRAALNQPPVPGARLGRDAAGNPAWFLSDPEQLGRYVQLALA